MEAYKYMVCTRCITFNHAHYIEDALRGFAMQETTFSAVFVVVDDASTDGTPEILRQWANNNLNTQDPIAYERDTDDAHVIFAPLNNKPNLHFVVFLLKYNHFSQKKPKDSYIAEWSDQAKYHAFCEGDDYWNHPLKLQKQFTFMEANPDYSLCGCSTIWRNELKGKAMKKGVVPHDQSFSTEYLILYPRMFPTVSYFIRNDVLQNRVKWDFPVGDIPIVLWCAIHGKVEMLAETMCVYRLFAKGSWTEQNANPKKRADVVRKMMAGAENFNEYTNHKYDKAIQEKIRNHRYTLALMTRDFDAIIHTDLAEKYKKRKLLYRMSDYFRCKHPKIYNKMQFFIGRNILLEE